ncbi:MAG: pyridoxal-phosphate dependent enzyme [Pseudomonadota bacterium]|nr:pyridoxal-phosphate dependent enzyme [Pseudomonadota bacterium]
MIVERMTDLIGNTPLLKIPAEVTGLKNIDLYGKLELLNPYGSVKDRIAWGMIKDDLEDMAANDQMIFENSSGNTAKAICAIAASYGVPFKLVSAIAKVKETKDLLRMLGAEIEEFAAASDCFDPNDPNDPQYLIEKAVREAGGKIYFTSQFTNEKNPEVHEKTTAQEVLEDLGSVDYFISGLGTTGSTLGMTRAFKKNNPDCVCVGLTSAKGEFVPGIRSLDQMWESGLYQRDNYADVVTVGEKAALDAMLTLNRRLGLLCGPSAGANYHGALEYLKTIDDSLTERKSAVFIVCDRVEWYMSYISDRMPEMFGEKEKPDSLFNFDETTAEKAQQINAADLDGWIAENDPVIVDIRSSIAYRMGHIDGAINLPIESFEKLIDSNSPFPKEKPVLLACAVGEKTTRHAAYLQSRGYRAYSVEGGMMALKAMKQQAKAA